MLAVESDMEKLQTYRFLSSLSRKSESPGVPRPVAAGDWELVTLTPGLSLKDYFSWKSLGMLAVKLGRN